MDLRSKYVFILMLCSVIFAEININTTAPSPIVSLEALYLIGTPSSKYPEVSFINFILYGHTDVPFQYSDFLNSYGKK